MRNILDFSQLLQVNADILAQFYVLLKANLIKIRVNDQLDAQFFSSYLFTQVLYVFPATKCLSSGQSIVPIRPLLYATECR